MSQTSSRSMNILFGIWLCSSLIIGFSYKSNLMAMLIMPKVEIPFNSLEELLAQDEIPYVMGRSSAYYLALKVQFVLSKVKSHVVQILMFSHYWIFTGA